jgi:hypothetical protein
MKLLSINADLKTTKGLKYGYLTGICYLAPYNESGVTNVCPFASIGCIATCLYTAGHGKLNLVKRARIERTDFLKFHKKEFLALLTIEIEKLIRQAEKKKLIPAIRFNGTSDLPIENIGILQAFPNIQFYDYTKNIDKMEKYIYGTLPNNYHLTFSRSENNTLYCGTVLERGYNVAVVFDTVPKSYEGYKVLNGDLSDLRFLDKSGYIVGLYAKGKAKKDKTGFVVRLNKGV